jgi:Leucine-rich repeat (LRR) protein
MIKKIEPQSFQGLESSLRFLSMKSNRLQFLKKYHFSALRNLERLFLQNNQISSIDKDTLRDQRKLLELNLRLTASQGERAMSAMNSAQADETAKPTV